MKYHPAFQTRLFFLDPGAVCPFKICITMKNGTNNKKQCAQIFLDID